MALTNHIVPDSPTNNFATLNPLLGTTGTFSNGNLNVAGSGSTKTGTIAFPSSGKYYYESMIGGVTSGYPVIGIVSIPINATGYVHSKQAAIRPVGSNSDRPEWVIDGVDREYDQISSTALAANDIIQVIYDADNGKVWFGINNTYYGVSSGSSTTVSASNIANGINPAYVIDTNYTYIPMVNTYSTSEVAKFNFGQDPTFGGASNLPTGAGDYDTDAAGNSTGGRFAFQPPTGALALCTANLPDFTPTVTGDVPQDYFKTVLYTGQTADSTFVDNGDNTWSKTGVGFQPDLIWAKSRSAATSHALADSVRGPRKILSSNSTADEYSETSGKTLLSFDSDGFTVGIDGNYTAFTASGSSIVAWCFRAGGPPSGSTSTTGSAKRINTSGTQDDTSCSALATAATNAGASNVITPTLMSINQAAGFSIVKYTGTGANATVPHGLSSAPEVILAKDLDATQQWHCGFTEIGWGSHIHLDLPNAPTGSSAWNSTAPASFFFSLGGNSGTNANGNDFIAYCWHSVEGYSKFGSYTGNGSPDGPFVYCGFRPAFVMVKNTSSTGSWTIKDTSRDTFNPSGYTLLADTADDDFGPGNTNIDILSNGWKCRSSSTYINTTNNNYIFMAFAEQPFKYANAR